VGSQETARRGRMVGRRGTRRRIVSLVVATVVGVAAMAGVAYAATEHYLSSYLTPPHSAYISNYHYITNDYVHYLGGGDRLLGCGSPEWSGYFYVYNECVVNYDGSRWARGYAENASDNNATLNAHVTY
jgi:hypothetical protein